MMQATIRRGGGLEHLISGMKPQQPETERHLEPVGEHPFSALLEKYKAFLDDRTYGDHHKKNADLTDILNPEHINAFLQSTVIHGNHEQYKERTGLFLSRLLQNSYNAGNNGFQVDTRSTGALDNLGVFLEGTKEKPIRLTITGDVGDDCGAYSTNGNYMITGDVGYDCGRLSINGTYTINGSVGEWCGFLSKDGTYRTPNRTTVEKFIRMILDANRVIYITPEGREEVIKR
ncbi:hypothetical protein HYX14_06220 [Candidatus Woesearchaeota archaeon]|nr:hypothetical protein [Candidatus Woesearchaeota archaeon]